MVDQERQDGRGNDEELHSERVMVPIISGFELAVNHPDCGERAGNVDHLSSEDEERFMGSQRVGHDRATDLI